MYFVDNNGSDANPGTQELPWKTITRVNLHAATVGFQPGDRISFKSGQTFVGNLVFGPNCSGQLENPVTVASYGHDRATINAGNVSDGFRLDSVSHVVIKDLNFVDGVAGVSPLKNSGIFLYGIGHDIDIENVHVKGFGGLGLSIGVDTAHPKSPGTFGHLPGEFLPSYSRVSITYSSFHRNRVGGVYGWNVSDTYVGHVKASDNCTDPNGEANAYWESGPGILFFCASDQVNLEHPHKRIVIERCVAARNGSPKGKGTCGGIGCIAGSQVLIQYNEAYSNRSGVGDGHGIYIDGTEKAVVQFNYTHDNVGAGQLLAAENWALPGFTRDNIIRYNVSENDMGNGVTIWIGPEDAGRKSDITKSNIYNNTIYTSTGSATSWSTCLKVSRFTGSVNVLNNLFVAGKNTRHNPLAMKDPDGHSQPVLRGNDYWTMNNDVFMIPWNGTVYNSEAAFYQGANQETLDGANVGLQVDPMLVKPGHGGTIGDADLLDTLSAYRIVSSPVASAGVGPDIAWDLFGFHHDPFMSRYFDTTPRDFYGNELPEGNPSIGASQGEALEFKTVVAGTQSLYALDLLDRLWMHKNGSWVFTGKGGESISVGVDENGNDAVAVNINQRIWLLYRHSEVWVDTGASGVMAIQGRAKGRNETFVVTSSGQLWSKIGGDVWNQVGAGVLKVHKAEGSVILSVDSSGGDVLTIRDPNDAIWQYAPWTQPAGGKLVQIPGRWK